MGKFTADADNFGWIDDKDDGKDLCLHGDAVVRIGDRTLEDSCCVSAAALYMLKSITEDHIIDTDNQMLPCCGFSIYADKTEENIFIVGCRNGTDWSVLHEEGHVRIVLEDGYETVVPLDEYREAVFRFADRIEAFYRSNLPRVLPDDEIDRTGYLTFWKEWHRRREK